MAANWTDSSVCLNGTNLSMGSTTRPGLSSKMLHMLSRLRQSDLCETAFLRLFRTMQAAGVSVLPNHFYWPVPDLRALEKQTWRMREPAFDLRLEAQADFATQVSQRYSAELNFALERNGDASRYHRNNGFFEAVDADVAYCLVRERKPRRIVEVGGGFSTRVIAAALRQNRQEGFECEFTSVEPYPDATLRAGMPGLSYLIDRKVQDAPMEAFTALEAGDILFIDSSHVAGVGSDVVYEFFEIFPRLRPGVIIHLHDIFYPSDYPRDAVLKFLWFWSEQYLLEALLTSNHSFEVLWGSSAMHLLQPQVLEECFPAWQKSYARMPAKARRFVPSADGERVWPSSFWMQKVA